ncbi:helix-turn-helix domain-containing protein [Stakelama sp. CBK3Z-3]|uniref:Helix-turn-helix domain-containing protein n=1 Tax=Stakelama flava TaxID=2860338 RepID=A0ABS6XR16_9SPHN|nr:helix-turn-helix domain-containing protein [Stakelama flava]MBW4332329.1 helix-turn-helix domain-containing protein [Stakelama flava]
MTNNFQDEVAPAKDIGGDLPPAIKSAERALRIIEFFAEIRRSARANEIASRLNIPQSSTSMLLNSLVRLGYLDIDYATHSYIPTLRVAMLGAWMDTGPFRDGTMLSMLERTAEETGFVVSLSQRNNIYIRYLHVIQAKGPTPHVSLALRRYAVWSSAGIATLISAPDNLIKRLVLTTRAEDDAFVGRINLAEVLEFVHGAEREGYFFSKEMVTAGTGSLSMPLPPSLTGHETTLAFTIGGNIAPLTERLEEMLDRMKASIRELRESLS